MSQKRSYFVKIELFVKISEGDIRLIEERKHFRAENMTALKKRLKIFEKARMLDLRKQYPDSVEREIRFSLVSEAEIIGRKAALRRQAQKDKQKRRLRAEDRRVASSQFPPVTEDD